MTTTDTPAAPSAAPPAALWEDFIDIFYAPRAVFARRPEGRWGWALLVVTLFTAILFVGVQAAAGPVLEAELTRALRQASSMTPEQVEQAQRMSSTFGVLGLLVTMPIGVVIIGLTLWVVGKLVDSVATLGMAIMIVTYAQLPRVVQQAVVAVQALVLDVRSMDSMQDLSLSPARFVDSAAVSPVVFTLLARGDVFLLWSTALLAIGLEVLGRVTRGRAYTAAALVWLIGALPALVGALARPG